MAIIDTFALPSRLYRYRPLDDDEKPHDILNRELKAITDGYVFCPTFKEMNDPMEGLHRETKSLRDHSRRTKIVEEIQQVVDKLGIASFSESHLNEPMWAHYAGQFRGMCVAYSFSRLRTALSSDHEFARMLYTEDAPILGTRKVDAAYRARVLLTAKNLKWASEREWRLIQDTRGEAQYRNTDCVVGVYLGARTPQDKIELVLKRLAPLAIPVFRMKVDTYETAFERISVKPKRRTS